MRLRYFAWLRTRIGTSAEDVALPAGVATVAELLDWLAGRGAGYADALDRRDIVRVAVNQEFAPLGHPVADCDEVALFPPVTGG